MAFDERGKAAAEAPSQEDAEEDGDERGAEGRPAAQAAGASASAVLAMLQRVAEEQASEISQIARCGPDAAGGKPCAAECSDLEQGGCTHCCWATLAPVPL